MIATLLQAAGKPLVLGQWAELARAWSAEDVSAYASVAGDANPLHLDPEFAAKTRFGQRIAHGMLSAGLFGTTLACHIPGAVYVKQDLEFTAPVYLDETVVARIEIASLKRRFVDFTTTAFVVDDDVALELERLECASDDRQGAQVVAEAVGTGRTKQVITGTARIMVPAR